MIGWRLASSPRCIPIEQEGLRHELFQNLFPLLRLPRLLLQPILLPMVSCENAPIIEIWQYRRSAAASRWASRTHEVAGGRCDRGGWHDACEVAPPVDDIYRSLSAWKSCAASQKPLEKIRFQPRTTVLMRATRSKQRRFLTPATQTSTEFKFYTTVTLRSIRADSLCLRQAFESSDTQICPSRSISLSHNFGHHFSLDGGILIDNVTQIEAGIGYVRDYACLCSYS